MKQLNQLLNLFIHDTPASLSIPFYKKDNGLMRIHAFAAIVICPLFALFAHFTTIPIAYTYFSLSYTFLFPVYVLICYKIPIFKKRLVFFIYTHLYCITIVAFYNFYSLDYPVEHLFYFSFIYILNLFTSQRIVTTMLYVLLVGGLFLLGFTVKYPQSFSVSIVISFYVLSAAASFLVLFSQQRLMQSIENYADYFKKIIDNPGIGFMLFLRQGHHNILIDYNNQASQLLGKNNSELDQIFSEFTPIDFCEIDKLRLGEKYTKSISASYPGSYQVHLDLDISIIQLKNGFYHLIHIIDNTAKNNERELQVRAQVAEENNKLLEIEIKEKIEAKRLLKEQFIRMNSIFDKSANTMLATINTSLEINVFNTYFAEYFKQFTQHEIYNGLNLVTFLSSHFKKDQIVKFIAAFKKVQKGNSVQIDACFDWEDEEKCLEIYLNPIMNIEGKLTEISVVAHDSTQKKKQSDKIIESIREKEILLKEIHHRVKNNLQIISSIINLQSASIKDEHILEILRESKNRIYTMATIHENLYQSAQFSFIQFDTYIHKLVQNVIGSYQSSSNQIEITYNLSPIELNIDQAIPCGLILNELLTNAVKYAFPNHKKGKINISVTEYNQVVTIVFEDNGIGLPPDLNIEETPTLGFQLVVTLIDQLDGQFNVFTDLGTKYLITFEKTKL